MFQNSGKFWNWLVSSSVDPGSVALTVRGLFSLGLVQLIFTSILPLFGVHPTFTLTDLGDGVSSIVYSALTVISSVVSLWAAIRKIAHTIVPNDPSQP